MAASHPLSDLPRIGPRSRAMLARAGITTVDELRRLGAVAAFAAARRAGGKASLNLLWAIEAALTGSDWREVARRHRTSLLLALEQHERAASPSRGPKPGRAVRSAPPAPSAKSAPPTASASASASARRPRNAGFDAGLAQRIRERLGAGVGVAEKRMFGGLAFLVRGHMCCGVSGDRLLARVGPGGYAAALARPHAHPMDFTGRPLTGFVYVDPPGIERDDDLADWLDACASFVATLPDR